MTFTEKQPTKINTDELIRDLLGLDPAQLATMNPTPGEANADALLGLQAFMRRILELAITLRDRRHLKIYLKTEESASRVHKWPDAEIANFGMLCLWAMLMEIRWLKGLPFAPLEAAKPDNVDPPVQIDRRLRRMSICALVAEWEKPMLIDTSRVGSGKQTFPVSADAMVREQLKVDPAMLTNGFVKTDLDVEVVFAGKPDARARAGLGMLLLEVLAKYWVMEERKTTMVRARFHRRQLCRTVFRQDPGPARVCHRTHASMYPN